MPGLRPPYLEAHANRIRARLDDDEPRFDAAEQIFREHDIPFWLAVTQLEHAELAGRSGAEGADGLLAEARTTFVRLEAQPWLERAERVGAEVAA